MGDTTQGEDVGRPRHTTRPPVDPSVVRIFPGSDPVFRAAVLAAVAGLDPRETAPGEALEIELRRDYAAVRVIEQDPLGADIDPPCVYVFRDGSLLPQPGDGPGATRYISPLVEAHRASVRNLLARERSSQVLARSDQAMMRSRHLHEVPNHPDGQVARPRNRGVIIEYPLDAKRERLADWLEEATAGRQDALEDVRATPGSYRDWTAWESWLSVEDERRAVIREEWSDPRPWAPPVEDD
jgi:hypothetical protein